MCRERWRTRDLLLEYNLDIMPPRPRSAGLNMVYPWETMDLSILSHQIIQLAKDNGYTGSDEEFWSKFTGGAIVTGTISTFPVTGLEVNLYLDTDTGILYYFKATAEPINPSNVALIGAAIVGQAQVGQNTYTYLYIPVRSMPMEDIIFDCGSAAEYID